MLTLSLDTKKDSILHSEPDHSLRADIIPLRQCILSSSRCGREDDYVYKYPTGTGGVSSTRVQDPTPHVDIYTPNSQVSVVYFHHEHLHDLHHCDHHKLELQDPSYSSYVQMGEADIP